MKSIIVSLLMLTLLGNVHGQVKSSLVEFSVTQDGRELFGLKNSSGEIILPANYSFIRWAEDYGLVGHPTAIEGTGLIDRQGKLIVEPSRYCDIQLYQKGSGQVVFVNGFAKVLICKENGDTLFGFINTSGKEVVAPQYARVGEFINGAVEVKTMNGEVFKIDATGKKM